jgi:hypothetical protein
MHKIIARNMAFYVLMAGAGAASAFCAPWLITERGSFGPVLLEAESIPLALLAAVIALAISTVIAIVVSRICNVAVGMFALGGGLFGLAWRCGTFTDFMHDGQASLLVIDLLIWIPLVLGASWLVFRCTGGLDDAPLPDHGKRPHPLLSLDAAKMLGVGVLIIPAVWVLAQSPARGQAIGAVFVGANLVGLAGRVVAPHVQPVALFIAPLIFGAVGYVIALSTAPASIADGFIARELSPLLLPMPLHYVAGSVAGVAMGLGWAKPWIKGAGDEAEPAPVRPRATAA